MLRFSLVALLTLSSLPAQWSPDSLSTPGNLTNVPANGSFTWPNVTGTNPNRGLMVLVTEADLPVQSVTLGGAPLTLVTSCYEPQYNRQGASAWKLSQPASGTAPIVVTLGGATQFHNTARNATALAFNVSSVDPVVVDKFACHASSADSHVYVQSEVVSLTTTLPNEMVLFGMMAPNTNDAAKVFNWPGIEDQLFVANSGDVSIYSHLTDSGAAGTYNYRWDWQNFEPVASVVVSLKPFASPQGGCSGPPTVATAGGVTWYQGCLSQRPPVCVPAGLNIFVAPDVQTLFWCIGPNGSSWLPPAPPEPLPGGDDWPVAFHDAGHSGRSADLVTPPLRLLWQWKNNSPYDVRSSTVPFYNLPIAFADKVCVQGGLNANRLICLRQDRSFVFEADNSGYTESGSVFQFLNYPAMVAGRIIFGSTDFTTTVGAADGSGFFNLYNTNGGWPYGGVTAFNGTAIQQFIETDTGLEDVIVYRSPSTLTKTCAWQQNAAPHWDTSFRVPATDGRAIYANVNGSVTAFDPVTCAISWSSAAVPGVSPAVNAGVAYYHNGSAMVASRGGSAVWSRVMPAVYSPIVNAGTIYGGAADGTFWALRAADGSALWSFRTQAAFTPLQIPALSGNLLYVPSADGRIYTLDALTGRLVDSFAGSVAWGPIIIAHGILYSSDSRGAVYAFRPSSARVGS